MRLTFTTKLKFGLCLLGGVLLGNNSLKSQTIQRQCIVSYAPTAESGFIQQTAGQSFSTLCYAESQITVRPGFQQSLFFAEVAPEIKQSLQLATLKAYPNPANYMLNIGCNQEINNASIFIYNNSGKLIYNDEINGTKEYQMDCSTWENGLYLVYLQKTKQD